MRKNIYQKPIEDLLKLGQPLTAMDIVKALKKKGFSSLNKTTIYRQLEKMAAKNEIEHVHLEGRAMAYERKGDHHHHLICESCDKVQDVVIKEDALFKKSIPKSFELKNHHIELIGVCANCK